MRIFSTGSRERMEEMKLKFPIVETSDLSLNPELLKEYDVIFDLNADENPSGLNLYASLENKIIAVCAVKKSLASLTSAQQPKIKCAFAGINALPTFLNRSKLEVSFLSEEDRRAFSGFADEIKVEFLEVKDSVGMVTPRVICMIINEACYSLHEGVATMEDIDRAMKLGTAYPYGPFEWCDHIGLANVYETLRAIWNDTKDERYKICPLLETKYLNRETFYS